MARYGRTRVCVYAVRSEEEAIAAGEAGVDAVGFVFNPRSARYINPEEAWEIASLLPPLLSTVGIFENASVEKFSQVEEVFPTDYTQLHGDESVETVRQCGPRVIKTVRFGTEKFEEQLRRWDELDEVDAILVAMGEGAAERTDALEQVAAAASGLVKPVLLGGGITAANVAGVIRVARPWAVVVSAGVEDEGGTKSPAKMLELVRAVREADAAGS